ncbi:MAG: cyclic nucleotide-binding domain-containing protein [Actinobacteria bacterium]|jgi:CRP-like cAMP-binding protein|nr:cyclic nucleotide-binding domain-containing protein [Actinomycetota bacterium]
MTDDVLLQRLTEVDLFAELPHKAIKHIAAEGKISQFQPGESVTEEGSSVSGWAPFSPEGVCFYVILEGSADVLVHGVHRVTLEAGQYFGETSLIDGKPRSATVTAGPDGMKAFALTAWAFAPVLKENPTAAMTMLKVLAGRLRAAEARA